MYRHGNYCWPLPITDESLVTHEQTKQITPTLKDFPCQDVCCRPDQAMHYRNLARLSIRHLPSLGIKFILLNT
jgi:hypothetical protein